MFCGCGFIVCWYRIASSNHSFLCSKKLDSSSVFICCLLSLSFWSGSLFLESFSFLSTIVSLEELELFLHEIVIIGNAVLKATDPIERIIFY
ncbi:hypothetical protein [Mycoplasmopsis alligatoris]|uniref:hypothetical protein n=1 Tax=Mycoplasmopsis alligatoris TaxID=47687 RepID=UPI0012EA974F|nr:hypothetical protein [Mycoplasmopsis alligatoris]